MSDVFDANMPYLILPQEAEQYIDQIREQALDEIGCSQAWIEAHHQMEKLNLQAHQSAQRKQDNYVVETLLTYQKYTTMIINLLTTELWKQEILPRLTCQDNEKAALRLYFIVYHEATLVNLLEVACFHEHVIETMEDDVVLEVIDYCVRKITWLIGLPRDLLSTTTSFHKNGTDMIRMMESQTPRTELKRQQMELEFRIAVQCITILRYIAERLHHLPLSTVSRLLDKHDVLLTLVVLIENPPWTYRMMEENQVIWKKFSQQEWKIVEPEDLLVLTTTEAQVWLTIYYLLSTSSAREHYEITSYRKDQLLRIRKYINELLIDQLPLLGDIQRYLDELAIMQTSTRAMGLKHTLVMETVPRLRQRLLQQSMDRLETVSQHFDQLSTTFERTKDLMELAQVYQMEGIEELLEHQAPLEQDKKEEKEIQEPQTVVLMFDNHVEKTSKLIQIIGEEENQDTLVNVKVMCQVDQDSRKVIDTTTHQYLRYTLHPSSTKEWIDADASVQAKIVFSSQEIQLECPRLDLPMPSDENNRKRSKHWKQIGVLQEDPKMVVQLQLILDEQARYYTLGALYLSISS